MAVTVVLLSLVVVLCLRRYRLRKKIEVRIEEERESVVDKVPPPADVVSEYDQVGHSFMASSRSMMSSVASLAHGRYDVNQTDASGPLVSGVQAHVFSLCVCVCVCVWCVCVCVCIVLSVCLVCVRDEMSVCMHAGVHECEIHTYLSCV